MSHLSVETLKAYRSHTFRLAPGRRVTSQEEAIDFVNERGFIYFWPISGITLPSLWVAVAGDRPVADAHDDPGHVSWGWKDALLDKQVWYYAKVLRRKATIISLDALPYFYALSENYGAPEEDYLTLYEQGRLTQEAKNIYEALLDNGALDTIALRKAAHLSSPENAARFERALTDLQTDFKILPVRVTEAGAWHYAYAYDITTRHFPDLIERTRFIDERQARQKLIELYLHSVGAIEGRHIARLFGWPPVELEGALQRLIERGVVRDGVKVEGEAAQWYALAELI